MNTKDDWDEMDSTAKGNLSASHYEVFLDYKLRLKSAGWHWEDAEPQLLEYIRHMCELYLHDEH